MKKVLGVVIASVVLLTCSATAAAGASRSVPRTDPPISQVQWGDSGTSNLSTGSSFNLPSNVASGDWVVLYVLLATHSAHVTGVSGLGANWVFGARAGSASTMIESWIGEGATGGSRAITVNTSSGTWTALGTELAGVSSVLSVASNGNATSHTNDNSISLWVPAGGAVVAGITTGAITSGPSGWTSWNGSIGPWKYSSGYDVAYILPNSAGGQTAAWTVTGSPSAMAVALSPSPATGIATAGIATSQTDFGGNAGAATRSGSFTTAGVGDIVMMSAFIEGTTAYSVSSVVSNNVTWTKVAGYNSSTSTNRIEIWYGIVHAVGADTVTVTLSGSTGAYSDFALVEYAAPFANPTWSVVAAGETDSSSTTSVTYPNLTSDTASYQLYWGYMGIAGSTAPETGTSQGFSYWNDNDGSMSVWNGQLSPSAAYAPTSTSQQKTWQSIGVIVSAS